MYREAIRKSQMFCHKCCVKNGGHLPSVSVPVTVNTEASGWPSD